jgi:uncharacterized protein YaiI (UPF0178 family)
MDIRRLPAQGKILSFMASARFSVVFGAIWRGNRAQSGFRLGANSYIQRRMLEPATPPRIFIDADACPVKEEIYKVAARLGVAVTVVAAGFIRVPHDPSITRIAAGDKLDAADDWIVEHLAAGDIVVTADIPLADRSHKAGAHVLTPTGRVLDDNSIGMTLATRNLMHDLRSAGETTSGNAPFSPRDRSNFLSALDRIVRRARRVQG